ncbi:MAG: dephospho-CoA kinase [Ferruginibacter sp.]
MLRIGLTGGIGSGKTTVAKIFEVLGIPVYSADEAARRLMNEPGPLKNQLIQSFGAEIYSNNEINTRLLSEKVFNDPSQLALINSIVHPATISDAREWMNKQSTPYVIKEAAILFEAGANKDLDYIIGVSSPRLLRIERIKQRDNVPEEKILLKMSKQMNEAEKMKQCDFVLINDEKQLLIPQVLTLHKKLQELGSA